MSQQEEVPLALEMAAYGAAGALAGSLLGLLVGRDPVAGAIGGAVTFGLVSSSRRLGRKVENHVAARRGRGQLAAQFR